MAQRTRASRANSIIQRISNEHITAQIYSSKTKFIPYEKAFAHNIGCALFSKFLGLNAVLVELDELSSGVPSFLKYDHGKLLRIAIFFSHVGVSWYMRHGLVITTRDCARGDSMRNFIRELCPGVFYTYGEPMFLLTDRL